MHRNRWVDKPLFRSVLLLTLASPLAVTACGGGKTEAAHANVKAGNMPDGGDWTGVFYNPVFGHLHLVKEASTVAGKWRTGAGDKWGELHGEVTGNLLRYEWVEHTIGMVGPNASSSGKGYFLYLGPKEKDGDDEIHGEWGLGASDSGTAWNAIRQRNVIPDLKSVEPDETQKTRGDNWDDSSGGGGKSDSDKSGSEKKSDDWN